MPSGQTGQGKPRERITKIDAARRQLKTAIRLFFQGGDAVSTHTLAHAIQELLRGLLKTKGGGSFIKDSDWIKPEYYKEYLEILNAPGNFFKHADLDPDEVLEFNSENTTFVLLDCAKMYYEFTGRALRECRVFGIWYALEYPHHVKPGLLAEHIKEVREVSGGAQISKDFFLTMIDRADIFPMQDCD